MYEFRPVNRTAYDREAAKKARQEEFARAPREYKGNRFARADLVDVRKPVYNFKPLKDAQGNSRNTSGSYTWLRLLPTRAANDPTRWADPCAADGASPGEFLARVTMWTGGYTGLASLIVRLPWEDPSEVRDHPANKLRWAVWKMAMKDNVLPYEYAQFMTKKAGPVMLPDGTEAKDYAALPLPGVDEVVLARALVYAWGDVRPDPIQGLGPDDRIHALHLSTTVIEGLAKDLGRNEVKGLGCGFVNDLARGCFHCVHRTGDDPSEDERFRTLGNGYSVSRADSPWPGGPTADVSAHGEVLWRKLVPWPDVLYKPSRTEAAEIIANLFPHEVLRAGWRGDYELLRVVDDVHGDPNKPSAWAEMHAGIRKRAYSAPATPAAPQPTYPAPQPAYSAPQQAPTASAQPAYPPNLRGSTDAAVGRGDDREAPAAARGDGVTPPWVAGGGAAAAPTAAPTAGVGALEKLRIARAARERGE